MQATTEDLRQLSIFAGLESDELAQIQLYAAVKSYLRGEIVLHEGRFAAGQAIRTFLQGTVQVKKTRL